ncbi:MAG: response regulator [Candidatus Brocadiia bacterium]
MATILLVDDDRALRAAAATALRNQGHHVREAESGEAALELARDTRVDLLVCDVRLPGIDGLELLRALRLRQPAVAAIVVTAYGSLETARQALRLGASDYLTKPFRVADLCAAAARVLGAREPRAPARSPFPLAPMPHELLLAPGETRWVRDAWRVGPGRRGILFAAEPAAGAEVLRGLLRATAAHRGRPQTVLASAQEWLGQELWAFLGVVDVPARVLRYACRGEVVAWLCGPQPDHAEDLGGGHEDVGLAIGEGSILVAASAEAAAAGPEQSLAEAEGLVAGAALRADLGALLHRLGEHTLTLRVPGAAEASIERTRRVAEEAGLDEMAASRVVAAVAEAVDNAERHAYEGRGQGMIEVRYLLTEDDLVVQVSDSGCGFDPAAAEPALLDGPDLYRESGRGFHMMRRLMDAMEVDSSPRRGTTVRMEKGRSRGDGN